VLAAVRRYTPPGPAASGPAAPQAAASQLTEAGGAPPAATS
jgi:hypothetical protein